MELLLRMRKLLVAVDVLMRDWARILKLQSADIFLLLLLGERDGQSGSDLAVVTGRTRQQTHRNLDSMAERGFISPAVVTHDGRTKAWRLTERGRRVVGVLNSQANLWERHLAESMDVELAIDVLTRGVRAIVNQPYDDRGWGYGLRTPNPLMKPELFALDALEEAAAWVEQRPPDPPLVLPSPRAAAEQEAAEAFHRMFNG